ncbi:MAG: restriction endonuclease [Chloroflexi bacterium]|nr:restriction endonuclease [Chloroflexota bacterium]
MRDPDNPWNPKTQVEITPQQFERQVLEWVKSSISSSSYDKITHQAIVPGQGGEYVIDIQVHLGLLKGASINILIECKHQRRSVERDEVLILEGKLRDTGAHKGILFATSGFQKGAISYAKAHGIATVTVINGSWLYETRSIDTIRLSLLSQS